MSEPRDFHPFLKLSERKQTAHDQEAENLDALRAEMDELAAVLPAPASTLR